MPELRFCELQCPYCGASVTAALDDSAGEQAYVEDCSVCCRPMEMRLLLGHDGRFRLEARRDDD
jgi:hypothetical protein